MSAPHIVNGSGVTGQPSTVTPHPTGGFGAILHVEGSIIGLVIGKGGDTIKSMQEKFNCRILVEKNTGNLLRKIEIIGPQFEMVSAALSEVNRVAEDARLRDANKLLQKQQQGHMHLKQQQQNQVPNHFEQQPNNIPAQPIAAPEIPLPPPPTTAAAGGNVLRSTHLIPKTNVIDKVYIDEIPRINSILTSANFSLPRDFYDGDKTTDNEIFISGLPKHLAESDFLKNIRGISSVYVLRNHKNISKGSVYLRFDDPGRAVSCYHDVLLANIHDLGEGVHLNRENCFFSLSNRILLGEKGVFCTDILSQLLGPGPGNNIKNLSQSIFNSTRSGPTKPPPAKTSLCFNSEYLTINLSEYSVNPNSTDFRIHLLCNHDPVENPEALQIINDQFGELVWALLENLFGQIHQNPGFYESILSTIKMRELSISPIERLLSYSSKEVKFPKVFLKSSNSYLLCNDLFKDLNSISISQMKKTHDNSICSIIPLRWSVEKDVFFLIHRRDSVQICLGSVNEPNVSKWPVIYETNLMNNLQIHEYTIFLPVMLANLNGETDMCVLVHFPEMTENAFQFYKISNPREKWERIESVNMSDQVSNILLNYFSTYERINNVYTVYRKKQSFLSFPADQKTSISSGHNVKISLTHYIEVKYNNVDTIDLELVTPTNSSAQLHSFCYSSGEIYGLSYEETSIDFYKVKITSVGINLSDKPVCTINYEDEGINGQIVPIYPDGVKFPLFLRVDESGNLFLYRIDLSNGKYVCLYECNSISKCGDISFINLSIDKGCHQLANDPGIYVDFPLSLNWLTPDLYQTKTNTTNSMRFDLKSIENIGEVSMLYEKFNGYYEYCGLSVSNLSILPGKKPDHSSNLKLYPLRWAPDKNIIYSLLHDGDKLSIATCAPISVNNWGQNSTTIQDFSIISAYGGGESPIDPFLLDSIDIHPFMLVDEDTLETTLYILVTQASNEQRIFSLINPTSGFDQSQIYDMLPKSEFWNQSIYLGVEGDSRVLTLLLNQNCSKVVKLDETMISEPIDFIVGKEDIIDVNPIYLYSRKIVEKNSVTWPVATFISVLNESRILSIYKVEMTERDSNGVTSRKLPTPVLISSIQLPTEALNVTPIFIPYQSEPILAVNLRNRIDYLRLHLIDICDVGNSFTTEYLFSETKGIHDCAKILNLNLDLCLSVIPREGSKILYDFINENLPCEVYRGLKSSLDGQVTLPLHIYENRREVMIEMERVVAQKAQTSW